MTYVSIKYSILCHCKYLCIKENSGAAEDDYHEEEEEDEEEDDEELEELCRHGPPSTQPGLWNCWYLFPWSNCVYAAVYMQLLAQGHWLNPAYIC